MKKRLVEESSSSQPSQPLPETIGGMSVVAVLRNQKQGLLVRLGEQRRQLEQQQHEMIALQRAHRAAESLVAALRNTWNLLDDNLRLFVRRLDPENAGATPVGTASAASGTAVFSELVRFFRAFQPEISLDETRLVAELQQRVAATKQTLEQLAKLASSGAKNERFDEIHTAFAGLLQRFSALNERNETLKAEHEEFSKKCASLADEVALLSRKNDRLSEQLREAREEGVLRLSSSAVVPEPAEKKRKNDDEPQKVGNEELEALTTRVAFLVEENAKLAAERDNNLLSYRNITEEAVREQQLVWAKKEQTTQQNMAAQLAEQLAAANDTLRSEREKSAVWKAGFEKQWSETTGALRKELSQLRKERDELRAKLDSLSNGGGGGLAAEELRRMLAVQNERVAALEAALQRERARPTPPQASAAPVDQQRASLTGELAAVRAQLEVEQSLARRHRDAAAAAEEKLRESAVVLSVWKKSAGDKRELNELKESEAVFKSRNAELSAKLEHVNGNVAKDLESEKERVLGLTKRLEEMGASLAKFESMVVDLEVERNAKKEELAMKEQETEALMGEMGNLVQGFEELQKQNERLIAELSKKDDSHSLLLQQKSASRQLEAVLREEKNELALKMAALKKLVQAQKNQITHLTEAADACESALSKMREETQLASAALEKERATVRDLRRGIDDLRRDCAEQTSLRSDAVKRMEVLLEERRAMEQEISRLKAQAHSQELSLASYRTKGADVLVQEQLRTLQQAARCSVCSNHYKNTVLTTCFHTFCRDCVNELITNRSRKCPRCGKAFDKLDVKTVYLDYEETN